MKKNNKFKEFNKKIVSIIIFFICFFYMNNVLASETDVMLTEELQNVNITEQEIIKNIEAEVYETGEIHKIEELGTSQTVQDIKVEVLEGDYKGKIFDTQYYISYDMNGKIESYSLNKGDNLNVQLVIENGEVKDVAILNFERSTYIYIMIAIFFIVILLIGRTKGIKAILAFLLTIVGIFFVMLQSIINGHDAVLMSILVSVGIIILTFIIISGFTKKTFTAIMGTSGGVICAGLIATLFGALAKLSGVSEEAVYLSTNTQNLVFNFRDLLFAGIIISSLGACMDVGMSIASALDEVEEKKPDITKIELIKSGMNIGSDIIGTMTNTLILAYIGGSINIVLLYIVEALTIGEILNIEIIATDIISAITASLGVMFTVPITALVYGLGKKEEKKVYETKSKNIVDGKRSLKL